MRTYVRAVLLISMLGAAETGAAQQRPKAEQQRPSAPAAAEQRSDTGRARPDVLIRTRAPKDVVFYEALEGSPELLVTPGVVAAPGVIAMRLPAPATPGRGVIPAPANRGFPIAPVAALAGLGALALLSTGDDDESAVTPPPVAVIPEPSTIVLLGTGMVLLLGVAGRMKTRRA